MRSTIETVHPTVDELLAHDGWMVENPRERQAENPAKFWLPNDDLRADIGPGSQVRVLLWFMDEAEPGQLVTQCERMWVLVETRDGDAVVGRLTSPPVSARAPLEMGSLIQIQPLDAIDILNVEPDWHDHRDFLKAMFDGDEALEAWKRSGPTSPEH